MRTAAHVARVGLPVMALLFSAMPIGSQMRVHSFSIPENNPIELDLEDPGVRVFSEQKVLPDAADQFHTNLTVLDVNGAGIKAFGSLGAGNMPFGSRAVSLVGKPGTRLDISQLRGKKKYMSFAGKYWSPMADHGSVLVVRDNVIQYSNIKMTDQPPGTEPQRTTRKGATPQKKGRASSK